jgi:hypothetical protein
MVGISDRFTITQDAGTITVVNKTAMGDVPMVYNLDGSPRTNTLDLGGTPLSLVTSSRWEGGKLIIVTTSDMGAGASDVTVSISLDGAGQLVVETVGMGQPLTVRFRKG